tara:strand:- start:5962 stop:6660 length:699 start_codon:yes stop_codon:yes gene_type:complete
MNLNKALSKVNVKLLNTLDHGMEIELTPEYTLYHYSEEDIVVIKRVSDWTELVQILWDKDEIDSIIYEIIEIDEYHIELGKPYKDTTRKTSDGVKYYNNLVAVVTILDIIHSDEEMIEIHPDYTSYSDDKILDIGSTHYGIYYIGNNKVTPDYESKYWELRNQVLDLFKTMKDNTIDLWRDDLEYTIECIALEDVEECCEDDECDMSQKACTGSDVRKAMEMITKNLSHDGI